MSYRLLQITSISSGFWQACQWQLGAPEWEKSVRYRTDAMSRHGSTLHANHGVGLRCPCSWRIDGAGYQPNCPPCPTLRRWAQADV